MHPPMVTLCPGLTAQTSAKTVMYQSATIPLNPIVLGERTREQDDLTLALMPSDAGGPIAKGTPVFSMDNHLQALPAADGAMPENINFLGAHTSGSTVEHSTAGTLNPFGEWSRSNTAGPHQLNRTGAARSDSGDWVLSQPMTTGFAADDHDFYVSQLFASKLVSYSLLLQVDNDCQMSALKTLFGHVGPDGAQRAPTLQDLLDRKNDPTLSAWLVANGARVTFSVLSTKPVPGLDDAVKASGCSNAALAACGALAAHADALVDEWMAGDPPINLAPLLTQSDPDWAIVYYAAREAMLLR
jgi:hypothetical protein